MVNIFIYSSIKKYSKKLTIKKYTGIKKYSNYIQTKQISINEINSD
jgi:hypothetical protein